MISSENYIGLQMLMLGFYRIPDYIKSCACMEVCRQVVLTLDVSFLMEYHDSAMQLVIIHILCRIKLLCLGYLMQVNLWRYHHYFQHPLVVGYLMTVFSLLHPHLSNLICISSLSFVSPPSLSFPQWSFFQHLHFWSFQRRSSVFCVLHVFKNTLQN